MKFTIITPSFNQLDYLKRCVASVADQVATESQAFDMRWEAGAESCELRAKSSITLHHHIQDGGSTDGTVDFLKEHQANSSRLTAASYSFSFASEADEGMYDAINRGVELALAGVRQEALGIIREEGDGVPRKALGVGDNSWQDPRQSTEAASQKSQRPIREDGVIAWLNCDEQYLPGALGKIAVFFAAHPGVDILFGGMLIVDAKGEFLACRKAIPMRKAFLEASYLYNYSCAMFFRQSFWNDLGGFDISFKNAGDEDLVRRALSMGVKSALLADYLSAFVYGGNNLSSDPAAVEEHERLKQSVSRISRIFRLPINVFRLSEKFIRGGHNQRDPMVYEIYAKQLDFRARFESANPSCSWPGELKPYLMKHGLKRK